MLRSISIGGLLATISPNTNYFFQGFAGNQLAGDPVFYDMSGASNNGAFGANLSNANAFANAGYILTTTPSGGNNDTAIRIPSLNFDYSGGQKFILWWLGIVATPAANTSIMGDGISSTIHGINIRATTAGKFQPIMYGASGANFGGTASTVCFNGSLNSIGLVLDGAAKKYGTWINETMDPSFGGGYALFNSGIDVDTKSTNTFNIGMAVGAPGGTDAIAVETRALAIFRLSSSSVTPLPATVTSIFKQLRANPGKLVLGSAF